MSMKNRFATLARVALFSWLAVFVQNSNRTPHEANVALWWDFGKLRSKKAFFQPFLHVQITIFLWSWSVFAYSLYSQKGPIAALREHTETAYNVCGVGGRKSLGETPHLKISNTVRIQTARPHLLTLPLLHQRTMDTF